MTARRLDDVAQEFAKKATGNYRAACPACAKRVERPSDKTLGVTVDQGGGVWHCFRCGAAGNWNDSRAHSHAGTVASKPKTERRLTLAANWLAYRRTLSPITGTAKAYLQARGCAIPPPDGDLYCTEARRHPSGYVGPALVALATDALTGEPLTLHTTWIRADGTKADVDPPRMLLGKHRKDGGVIRLWPDEAVATGLGVAEGIETALTLATAFTPVWAAIDAGNLAKLPVLDGIESLLIAADNDPAGLAATEQCALRWAQAGRDVRIAKSPVPGEDLNDFAMRAA